MSQRSPYSGRKDSCVIVRSSDTGSGRKEIPASLPAIAVFARAPIPGKTKTRLIPALGPHGAAELHRTLVSDTLRKVARLRTESAHYLFVADGKIPEQIIPHEFQLRRQTGRNLGTRLERAFGKLLQQHPSVIIIGTDSPAFAPSMLRLALQELRTTDAVLGPCPDGGYYLIGLRRTVRGLFSKVRLGSEFAMQDTLGSLLAHGFSCSVLEPYPDIDLPSDLVNLKISLTRKPASRRLMPQTWRFLSKIV